MTFRKIQCVWMKLKALTMTYHLNGIYYPRKYLNPETEYITLSRKEMRVLKKQMASMKQTLGLMYGNHA